LGGLISAVSSVEARGGSSSLFTTGLLCLNPELANNQDVMKGLIAPPQCSIKWLILYAILFASAASFFFVEVARQSIRPEPAFSTLLMPAVLVWLLMFAHGLLNRLSEKHRRSVCLRDHEIEVWSGNNNPGIMIFLLLSAAAGTLGMAAYGLHASVWGLAGAGASLLPAIVAGQCSRSRRFWARLVLEDVVSFELASNRRQLLCRMADGKIRMLPRSGELESFIQQRTLLSPGERH
jgi:hypothetical protein